ncbi:MAG: putative endonuclease [Arenicella sp.]|jgi:putative endonuclease
MTGLAFTAILSVGPYRDLLLKVQGGLSMKQGYVYIISNIKRNVIYIGVTSNLAQRLYQHRSKTVEGFSKKYNCVYLLWWEQPDSIVSAIEREKQLKGWTRAKKDILIKRQNPELKDLANELFCW